MGSFNFMTFNVNLWGCSLKVYRRGPKHSTHELHVVYKQLFSGKQQDNFPGKYFLSREGLYLATHI